MLNDSSARPRLGLYVTDREISKCDAVTDIENPPFKRIMVCDSRGNEYGRVAQKRRCHCCNAIFYAVRTDAHLCSPRCRKAMERIRKKVDQVVADQAATKGGGM